jgi:hypothetical protein
MYELFMNQLVKVETFQSPNQPSGQAVIKTSVATVTGYGLDTTLFFDTIPEKNTPEGGESELHYINDELVWVHITKPPTTDERVFLLEQENATLTAKANQAAVIATATSTDLQALTDYLAETGVI